VLDSPTSVADRVFPPTTTTGFSTSSALAVRQPRGHSLYPSLQDKLMTDTSTRTHPAALHWQPGIGVGNFNIQYSTTSSQSNGQNKAENSNTTRVLNKKKRFKKLSETRAGACGRSRAAPCQRIFSRYFS
jgi:hypothetical protein